MQIFKFIIYINNKSQGYFAIVTSIILSLLVLMIAASLSLSGFNTRFNSLGFESKDKSYSLAYACLEDAILKYRETSTYSGNEIINIGSDTCEILTFTASGSDEIINTKASKDNRTTNLSALYNSASTSVVYLRELAN